LVTPALSQSITWIAKLRNEGWKVKVFSIAETIVSILENAPLRHIWLAADRKAPLVWDKTNCSLANALARGALQTRLEAALEALEDQVFVTVGNLVTPALSQSITWCFHRCLFWR
jgi:hypothetical protein